MKKEKLTREDILDITGREMPCAKDCLIGRQCFGGYVNENPECDDAINKLRQIFSNLNLTNLLMTQRFFGIRVFDSSSVERPLPAIGTLLIEKGSISLLKE